MDETGAWCHWLDIGVETAKREMLKTRDDNRKRKGSKSKEITGE
jgi:hypothetical protein